MDTLKADKYVLRKFGVSLAIALLLITLFISIKSPQKIWLTLFLSFAFYLSALIKPSLLKPIHVVLARAGLVMAWLMRRLALFIIFYFLFTPLGLIMRLFGNDPLDRKIDRHKGSYWKVKEKNTPGPSGYEKQF